MYLQAQRAFGVSPDRHYRLLHAAAEEKPKIVVLSVIVLEAENLEAKDANGEFEKTLRKLFFEGKENWNQNRYIEVWKEKFPLSYRNKKKVFLLFAPKDF